MGSVDEISQLCRLCLVKDQVNIPIFDESSDIGQIFMKINSCLPVKVSRDDNLPKKICDGCSYKLDMLYIFHNTTIDSEKQLISWLNQAGLSTISQTAVKDPLANTKPEVMVKQETFDSTDARIEGDPTGMGMDAQNYIIQQQQLPYQQDFDFGEASGSTAELTEEPAPKRAKRAAALKKVPIDETEETEDDLDAAMQITKAEEEDSEDVDQPEYVEAPSTSADDQPGPSGVGKAAVEAPVNSLLEKLICGPSISITPVENQVKTSKKRKRIRKKADSDEEFVMELIDSDQTIEDPLGESKSSNTEAVHCEICDESYPNNIAFALHSIDHNSDKKYSCHFCDYRNASKYHIEMHIKAHEGTTKYKCEICHKAFTVSTHAIEHKYYHTGEKPFQCEICGKHFMFSWFLTSHRRTQHWEIMTGTPLVKYDCTICNKHYTSSTGLRRHNLSKHNPGGGDSSMLCDICGKCLSSKEKLKFHRRIHTGYKPFACVICSKSFSRKEQLKEHERVHTGEKPFICNFCGKGFTQRSPLRIHERTHTGERPYICRLCGKGYISKGVMDTHMKSCSAIPIY